jgi:hypothetical protein
MRATWWRAQAQAHMMPFLPQRESYPGQLAQCRAKKIQPSASHRLQHSQQGEPSSPHHRAPSTLRQGVCRPHLHTVSGCVRWIYACKLTETCVGVLSLDPLAPILGEEHVGGQSTFGCVGVLLRLATGHFLNLFFTLQRVVSNAGEAINTSLER